MAQTVVLRIAGCDDVGRDEVDDVACDVDGRGWPIRDIMGVVSGVSGVLSVEWQRSYGGGLVVVDIVPGLEMTQMECPFIKVGFLSLGFSFYKLNT